MSAFLKRVDRRMLPRWRLSVDASKASDFVSLKPPPIVSANREAEFSDRKDEWERAPDELGRAADTLAAAMFAGKNAEAKAIAHFILSNECGVPATLIALARQIGEIPHAHAENTLMQEGRETKRLLRLNPRNPMLWADLARHNAGIRRGDKARRYMLTALQLAPQHRWVLRAASRFLVHHEDPVAAHRLLAKSPATKQDPWLIAAEIACAQVAGRAPQFWRQANDILRWDSVAPAHTSELAMAVAMMEIESGNRKPAKKLIKKGLRVPTENTLAQLSWAEETRHLDGFGLEGRVATMEDAHEARHRVSLINGDVIAALTAARTWAKDEPFATRPLATVVYIAGLLDDYELALNTADKVRQLTGPDADPTLEMNRIFCRLSAGDLDPQRDRETLEEMAVYLDRMTTRGGNEIMPHAMANAGLLQFRYGDPAQGQALYERAIDLTEKTNPLSAANAAIFHAREAILSRTENAPAALARAKALAARTNIHAPQFYLRKLDALAKDPSRAGQILVPAAAGQYNTSSAPSFRIEKKGKQFTIWVPRIPQT